VRLVQYRARKQAAPLIGQPLAYARYCTGASMSCGSI